jgi:predicted amidophosphoribosyltransferase
MSDFVWCPRCGRPAKPDVKCSHCGYQPPPPTPAEVRQAVAFGRQAMLREAVDQLLVEARLLGGDFRAGYLAAVDDLKKIRIEGEPKP